VRCAALLRGEKPEPVRPVIVERLAGRSPAAADSRAGANCEVSPAVPRVVASPAVPPTNVVGKPEHKVEALRLVKGNPAFTDDVQPRGMLHAKVLRSPHAHARIIAIDDTGARALPGVHAVLHHFNTRRVKHASGGQSWPNPYPWDQVSFDDKVRHVGDRVAAVAAETVDLAAEACRRIKVTYEALPAVFDELEALADGAPGIHDEQDSVGIHDAARNISSHIEGQTVADMETALARADHVFEQTFHLHQVQHCCIEPHVTIGWFDEAERLVLRTSTQVPFHIRRMVAPLLGLPVKRVRVIKPRIGGGFGGKQEMLIEDIVGHLVLATRRPVRLELTREEEFSSARTRHKQAITFRTGVGDDGKLVALDMKVVANTGGYGVHGFTVQSVTGLRGLSSYNCPPSATSATLCTPTGWWPGRCAATARRRASSRLSPTWTTSPGRCASTRSSCAGRTGSGLATPSTSLLGSASGAASMTSAPKTCRVSPVAAPRNAWRRRCGRSAGTGATTSHGNGRLTGPASGGASGLPCASWARASRTSTWAPRSSR
jgi:putative selenate reductase molybdopterin-binding subunit